MIEGLLHSMIVCPDTDRQYPRVTHGKGVFLYDENGREYLDASSGSAAVSNLGYGLTELADVIAAQMARIAVTPTHAFSSPETESYLKALVDFAPPGFKRAWTASSGTEGVENAVKAALQYHQLRGDNDRYKIISRWSSYHGNSIFMLDIGGMRYRRESYAKWLNNFPHISPAYKYRLGDGLTEEEYTAHCLAEFENCIKENDPTTIAAFVAEPVVGAALGAVPPPAGYFTGIRNLCDQYGILFIVDEVMTGYGRLGTNFGIEKFAATPDIIAAGKGIGGGYYPLSAVIVSEKIAQIFEETKRPFLGGHTFACNPVGAAAGQFVIEYMQKTKLVENASIQGKTFGRLLKELEDVEIIGDVRGEGLMWGLEFVSDKVKKTPFPRELNISKAVAREAFSRGLIIYPGGGSADGILGDHMLICPPLCISEKEIEQLVHILKNAVLSVVSEMSEYSV
jgi:adenosylmethionine-8-amino-7-oxononanoate aminotransferase